MVFLLPSPAQSSQIQLRELSTSTCHASHSLGKLFCWSITEDTLPVKYQTTSGAVYLLQCGYYTFIIYTLQRIFGVVSIRLRVIK